MKILHRYTHVHTILNERMWDSRYIGPDFAGWGAVQVHWMRRLLLDDMWLFAPGTVILLWVLEHVELVHQKVQVIASCCFQDAAFQHLPTCSACWNWAFQRASYQKDHKISTNWRRMTSPAGCDEWHVQALNWDSSSETWIECDEAIRLSSPVWLNRSPLSLPMFFFIFCWEHSVHACSSHVDPCTVLVVYAQYARISLHGFGMVRLRIGLPCDPSLEAAVQMQFLQQTEPCYNMLKLLKLSRIENMFAANPAFARIESRISFDMLKSLKASILLVSLSKT